MESVDFTFDLARDYFLNAAEGEKIKGNGDTGYTTV